MNNQPHGGFALHFSTSNARRWISVATVVTFAFASSGCGRGKKSIPGVDNLNVGVAQNHLYAGFVAKNLKLDIGGTFPIPGIRDATIGLAPDLNSDGTVFQASIPLASLMGEGRPFSPRGLPDGRGIPDIQGGVLPRWDESFSSLHLSLYLSNQVFALFIPLKFKIPSMLSMRIEDDRGNLLGKAYAIPANKDGTGSGLFLLLPHVGGAPQDVETAVRRAP